MQRVRGLLAAIAAALLTLLGVAVPAQAGNGVANDITGEIVTGITLTPVNGTPVAISHPVVATIALSTEFNSAGLRAVDDGDWFTIAFPLQVSLGNGTLDLEGLDPVTGDPVVLANCLATNADNTLTCTLNAAAASRSFVSGSIDATTTAAEVGTFTTVDFTLGASPTTTLPVDFPGGEIVPETRGPIPDTPEKWAWPEEVNPNEILWTVMVPANIVAEGADITIDDQMQGAHTMVDPFSVQITQYADEASWQQIDPHLGVTIDVQPGTDSYQFASGADADITLNVNPPESFQLIFPNMDVDADGLYVIQYVTVADADLADGSLLTNTANVNGRDYVLNHVYDNHLIGNLNGPGFGGLVVSKTVSGSGAGAAAGEEFTIRATWTEAGVLEEELLIVEAGGVGVGINGIPAGTAVTLTEVTSVVIPGVTSYTPQFIAVAGDVAVAADEASAVVTIGDQATASIRVNNDTVVASTPSVSVGDYVWHDVNRDGRQDTTDIPLEGVTLTLTGPDGGSVTDINGNPVNPTTTNRDGWYEFTDLPILQPGQSYTVTVTNPDGYQPTQANQGTRDGDSDTGSATSGDLTTDGARDETLDFGFVTTPASPQLPGPGTPQVPGTTAPPLAVTGAPASGLLISAALMMLIAGITLVVARRRRV
ncbi:MAG: SdrD B-like domain-containing protein [Beutenbergiaceae bacterium]